MRKKDKLTWKYNFGDCLVILGAWIAMGGLTLLGVYLLWQRFL